MALGSRGGGLLAGGEAASWRKIRSLRLRAQGSSSLASGPSSRLDSCGERSRLGRRPRPPLAFSLKGLASSRRALAGGRRGSSGGALFP